MKLGDFVDWKLFLRSPAIKTAFFMAGKVFSRSVAKISGVFLAAERADKKETPSKGCLCNYLVMRSPIRPGMTSLPA